MGGRDVLRHLGAGEQGKEFAPQKKAIWRSGVDDVAAARAELEAQGRGVLRRDARHGVCHMAFFTDPDGNDLMLHQRYAPYESSRAGARRRGQARDGSRERLAVGRRGARAGRGQLQSCPPGSARRRRRRSAGAGPGGADRGGRRRRATDEQRDPARRSGSARRRELVGSGGRGPVSTGAPARLGHGQSAILRGRCRRRTWRSLAEVSRHSTGRSRKAPRPLCASRPGYRVDPGHSRP